MLAQDLSGFVITVAPSYVPRFGVCVQPGSFRAHIESFFERLELGFVRKKLTVGSALSVACVLVQGLEEVKTKSVDRGPLSCTIGDHDGPPFGRVQLFEIRGRDVLHPVHLVDVGTELAGFVFAKYLRAVRWHLQKTLESGMTTFLRMDQSQSFNSAIPLIISIKKYTGRNR